MKFVKALLLILCGALLATSLVARNPRGVATGPTSSGHANYVGTNFDTLSYFNADMPCLNILNCAGQNGYTIWQTSPAEMCVPSCGQSGQDGAIAVDVNGYPTSLTPTASSGVTAGAAHTNINTFMFTNMPALAPGQTVL